MQPSWAGITFGFQNEQYIKATEPQKSAKLRVQCTLYTKHSFNHVYLVYMLLCVFVCVLLLSCQ